MDVDLRAGIGHDCRLFVGSRIVTQRQSRAVVDVQDVNIVFAHGKQDSIFVLTTTMEKLTNLEINEFALRRKRTPLRKNSQRA